MTVVPHLPYFSLVPRLKIKMKDRHFVTVEVIEAKSSIRSKNGRGAVYVPYARRGVLRGRWWQVGPKITFEQMAAPAPNY
jgi:hypothetical protein